jgi:hypothetical protein
MKELISITVPTVTHGFATRELNVVGRRPQRLPIQAPVALVLAMAALLALSCDRNTDSVRIEHKVHSAKKETIYNSGEMAGRVIFNTGPEGVAAPGASVIVLEATGSREVLEQLQKEPDATCMKRLADMQTALLSAAKASADAGHTPPTATADADGYFILPQVRPGTYMVVAYGRAGDVQAMWEQPAVVEPYQAVMVKLVDPLISCAAEEQKPSQPPPLPPPQPIPHQPTQPAPAAPQPTVPSTQPPAGTS